MVKNLETIIELAIDEKDKDYPQNCPKDAVIQVLYNEIYAEIQDEVLKNYAKTLEAEMLKDLEDIRIREFKELAFSGLFLALVVGLLVNQLTDILGIFKGTVLESVLCLTIVFSIAFVFISGGIFFHGFQRKLNKFIETKEIK